MQKDRILCPRGTKTRPEEQSPALGPRDKPGPPPRPQTLGSPPAFQEEVLNPTESPLLQALLFLSTP